MTHDNQAGPTSGRPGVFVRLWRWFFSQSKRAWGVIAASAFALGIVFWGDRPGPRLWIGGAMVLGGVLSIALRQRFKMLMRNQKGAASR